MSDNMNPNLPSQSITDIREKRDNSPDQGLPSQNKQSSDFIGYGVLPGAIKPDAPKMGNI